MRLFEALADCSFRKGPHGQRVFFPWGMHGTGYIVHSERIYIRLRRHMANSIGVSFLFAPIIALAWLSQSLAAWALVLALFIAFSIAAGIYWRAQCKNLRRAKEIITLAGSLMAQAPVYGRPLLWILLIANILFTAGSSFLSLWLTSFNALLGVALFGFATMLCSTMLLALRLIERRNSSDSPDSPRVAGGKRRR